MNPTEVCSLDDLPDGTMRAFRVEGRDLLLVRNGDQVYALRDICPHQGAPLSAGVLTCARLAGGVGEHRADRSNRIIRCPWHNWEFDAGDGAALHDPTRRVASYPASIRSGQVVVEL